MSVVVDTSAWVEYFRSGSNARQLDFYIDENLVATNDLILAELIPLLKVRNQQRVIDLLRNVFRLELAIQWEQIIELQYRCLKAGLNGIGLPDLIIAQNAKQHNCSVYSLDGHFTKMKDIVGIECV